MKFNLLIVWALLMAGSIAGATTLENPTDLKTLSSGEPCNQCNGTLLAGRTYQSPETKWGIISDLPESFGSYGVLYSTRDVLPDNGGAEELRHQRKTNAFRTIDGGFDVFFFHLSRMAAGSRIAVYVKNRGTEAVTLRPGQVIKSEGIIGSEHEFESTLGKRVLAREWDQTKVTSLPMALPDITFEASADHQLGRVNIAPGEGRVIAYGKQFGNVDDGPDASHNVNCFGYVRASLGETKSQADLEVSVIAIPAGPREQIQAETEKLIDTGARSTDEVPMDREPQECALGRAVGVYPNFTWKNDPLVIDASKLDAGGTSFSMCLPKVQTAGCADARQTTDLALRPGYTREDTIGNYMIEYLIIATLVNPTQAAVSTDMVFSKTGADVGLAYTLATRPIGVSQRGPAEHRVESMWAGPKQSAREKSLLKDGQPIVIPPGGQTQVSLKFMVCGNSSLPFNLGFKRSR